MSQLKFRYTVESWFCDYGIFDNLNKCFIGSPLSTRYEAENNLSIIKVFLAESPAPDPWNCQFILFSESLGMYLPKESVQSEEFKSAQ